MRPFVRKNIIKMKRVFQNILLLFLSITIGLIIIEFVVRQIDQEQYAKNSLYFITDYSIFAYIPNKHINFERQEFVADIKINSKGIRDYEYDHEKKENVRRIAMLGDSFIAAFQVPLEKSVSNKLEKLLNENSESKIRYEVLNMGLGGTGPTPQVIFLEKEGIKYDPDIVISNLFVANDFVKVDFGVSGVIPKEIFENSNNLENVSFKVTKIQKLKNFIFRNYFTYSYLNKIISDTKYQENDEAAYPELNIYKKQYPEYVGKNLEKLKVILKHLKTYTDEKEIKLLIVLIPMKEQVDERKFSELMDKYKLDKSQLEIKKAQEILLEFGGKNSITMLDMLPGFSKRNKNNTFYFEIDGHWNEKGHKLAANLIYEKLINEGFISP